METRTRQIGIAVFGLGAVAVLCVAALWSKSCSRQIPPLESPAAPRTATWTPTSTRVLPVATATPGPSPMPPALQTAWAEFVMATAEAINARATATAEAISVTVTAMAELGTLVPTSTPGPTPTMTEREQALMTERQHAHAQSAASPDECGKILETQPWCNVTRYARRITRPEWEALFPYTEFYLVKYDRYGSEFVETRNVLIVEQDGRRFSLKEFHTLLGWNHIKITDENREPVAKAFVLMSLEDYLDEEIVFSDWEEGSWPSAIRMPYNYTITAWTKIQGLKFEWLFLFDEEGLFGAEGLAIERNIGDYIDVPFENLPTPSRIDLTYWRKQQWQQ